MGNSLFDVNKDVVPFVTFLSGYDGSAVSFGDRCSLFSVGIELLQGDAHELENIIEALAYAKMGENLFIGGYSRLRFSHVEDNNFVLCIDAQEHPNGFVEVVNNLVSIVDALLETTKDRFTLNLHRCMKVTDTFIGIQTVITEIEDETTKEIVDAVDIANTMIGPVFYSDESIYSMYTNSIALEFKEGLTKEKFREMKIAISNSIEMIVDRISSESCPGIDIEKAFKIYKSGDDICIMYKSEHDCAAIIGTMLMNLIKEKYKFKIKRLENFDASAIEWIKQRGSVLDFKK